MNYHKGKQKNASGLKGQLENYAAAVGAIGATLRQRMGNWPIYAAATGSAMAMATSASADTIIVYMGVPVTLAAPGNSGHYSIIQLPDVAFRIEVNHNTTGFRSGEARGYIGSTGSILIGPDGSPRNLVAGSLISSQAGHFTNSLTQGLEQKGELNRGNWVPGVPGFEGFRIGSNFGWAELEVGVDGDGYPDSVTLLGLAYNNSGAPIMAGELPPMAPEPGTAGLMLLALGAAGVTVLRKRRQSAAIPGQTSVSDGARPQ